MFFGHIVSREGIVVDPGKIKAILTDPTPKNAEELSRFLGQIRWHSRMMRRLADFATPLHVAVHRTTFSWSKMEDLGLYGIKSHAHTGTGGTST